MVKRLTPDERAIFAAHAKAGQDVPPEPAMGTLAERLEILCRRHHAPPNRPRTDGLLRARIRLSIQYQLDIGELS